MVTKSATIKGFDFTKEEVRKAINKGKLLQVSVNISAKCNYFCDYCLMSSGKPKENELTNDEIKRVLKEAKNLGAKTWYIAGDGEPLLHNGIEDLIDYANGLGMWVVMATNGEFLTRNKAEELKQKNISIITKFNSFDKRIFDELVKVDATFKKFKGTYIPKGVISLIKAGFNNYDIPRAGVETVVTTKNIHEIPKVYDFALKHNIFANIEMMLPIGRAANHPELIPTENQIRNLYSELNKIAGSNINPLISSHLSHYGGIRCFSRLRYSLYTNSVGNVYLCFSQHPELSTGMNVRDFTLKDILAKRRFPEIPVECACEYFSEMCDKRTYKK